MNIVRDYSTKVATRDEARIRSAWQAEIERIETDDEIREWFRRTWIVIGRLVGEHRRALRLQSWVRFDVLTGTGEAVMPVRVCFFGDGAELALVAPGLVEGAEVRVEGRLAWKDEGKTPVLLTKLVRPK